MKLKVFYISKDKFLLTSTPILLSLALYEKNKKLPLLKRELL